MNGKILFAKHFFYYVKILALKKYNVWYEQIKINCHLLSKNEKPFLKFPTYVKLEIIYFFKWKLQENFQILR
jgi:hypothetical protein